MSSIKCTPLSTIKILSTVRFPTGSRGASYKPGTHVGKGGEVEDRRYTDACARNHLTAAPVDHIMPVCGEESAGKTKSLLKQFFRVSSKLLRTV